MTKRKQRINLKKHTLLLVIGISILLCIHGQEKLSLNEQDYFEMPGFNVLVFSDSYMEGHQGGIQIIHHGNRVAANSDIRLEGTPGQWQAFAQLDNTSIDKNTQTITLSLSYPNVEAQKRKFNPIQYPDLEFSYQIRVKAENNSIRIVVDLDKPLPKKWEGKIGFHLELFPGNLFGKYYYMDDKTGIFPPQLNGPFHKINHEYDVMPMAEGINLVIAPESEEQRISIRSYNGTIELLDGRAQHNNGWFIVRSIIPKGAKEHAIEWLITPSLIENWKYEPVIHINQAGYLSNQPKTALIECDKSDTSINTIELNKVLTNGKTQTVISDIAKEWGIYQRYRYFNFDFTSVTESGIYFLSLNDHQSELFRIGDDVYDRDVWQPTLEYFLPVQMCHMRVNDRYKVWHGQCHMDDARMAPINTMHFDGYFQDSSTHTTYKSGEHVPGLNAGGWHDAGDYDLRVESQGGTIYVLSMIYELFGIDYDITTIDQSRHLVEMHVPDGQPDILQQIEHGAISIVRGYQSLGRLYRGIICSDLRQYVILGDGSTMTNNISYTHGSSESDLPSWLGNTNDDRWVFTDINPKRELMVCSQLAAASRVLKGYNDTLSEQCIAIAELIWQENHESEHVVPKIQALAELYITTEKEEYLDAVVAMAEAIRINIDKCGWAVCRILKDIDDNAFRRGFTISLQEYYRELKKSTESNPFGVPYHPRIWGSAWDIEKFGIEQYYLFRTLGNNDSKDYFLNALNYVLGIHPGENTSSFVSGVGTKSATVAYGLNRDDWSYIPGGVISGTANIKPDFPELKTWPYLWQQTEYVISGAASGFTFLVLAAKEVLGE